MQLSSLRNHLIRLVDRFDNNYTNFLIYKKEYQPLICTFVKKKIKAKSKQCILYKSRLKINGSIVSHLGEVYLGSKARGKILDKII